MPGSPPRHFVVMGVSGSGKTTIAKRLAECLEYAFADGDDFHPRTLVAKMARGEPLTDVDREPWLEALAAWIATQHRTDRSSVLACSALKRRYRETLRGGAPQRVFFVHLTAPAATLRERLACRTGHYMPQELLASQLATLEALDRDEPGITVEAARAPADVLKTVLEYTVVTN